MSAPPPPGLHRASPPGSSLWQACRREPLVHFVAIGLLLLGVQRLQHALLPSPERIELGRTEQQGVRADLQRRLGRAPTAAEQGTALSRLIDDEILFREARRRGLDQGDVIVRRRLIQKMELLAEALAPVEVPTEADLLAQRDRSPERYREPARIAIEHAFLSRDAHGAATPQLAASAQERLEAGAQLSAVGDPFPHGSSLGLRSEAQLAAVLGTELARAAMALPQGRWSAPLPSSYGLHVVRVTARTEPRLPEVRELSARLLEDWHEARRGERLRRALDQLRAGYTVHTVPLDEPAPARGARGE